MTFAGLVVFAGASLACGLADGIGLLLAARCVQAVGGAAAVCAALELMPRGLRAPSATAARAWAAAGAAGAALGPGIGGLLTELVSWQSIFLVQVPVALVLAVAVAASVARRGADASRGPAPRDGPAAPRRQRRPWR